jgi:hypothetical protein
VEVFDSDLVMNLKSVVDATGAKIVLSSDWRRDRLSVEMARRNLQAHGLDIISRTPSLSPWVPVRPAEIVQWIDEYCRSGKISAWIAIDDRNLLEEQQGHHLRGHFVRTKPSIGLDRGTARHCIQLLQQQSGDCHRKTISNPLAHTHMRTRSDPNAWSMDAFAQRKQCAVNVDNYAQDAYGGFHAASVSPSPKKDARSPQQCPMQCYHSQAVGTMAAGPDMQALVSPRYKPDYWSEAMMSPRHQLAYPKCTDRLLNLPSPSRCPLGKIDNIVSVPNPAIAA